MTREVILYITASLDGYIADVNGGVGWLAGAEDGDYGYPALLRSVDTVLQGSRTYLDSLGLVDHDPYEGMRNYVFSSRHDLPDNPGVTVVRENPVEFVRALKEREGERIWLIGGGLLASALLDAGLVDEIDLFIQPVLLGDGIGLWHTLAGAKSLRLVGTRAWPAELVELNYRFA
jgi:dihydrofolate reductase